MIKKAAEYIKERITDEYTIGIICGSGLGQLCDRIEDPVYIDYKDIPGFPVSTAPGHKGRFVFGSLSGKKVVCMQGRVHFYEGYTPEQVVMPVRVMSLIGVKTLILTNAAGGINEKYRIGEIMTIKDHINFTGFNCLVGPNDDTLGTRFPDMSYAYDPALIFLADECAKNMELKLRHGTYLGLTGPSYETPAEIRAFRLLGADAVGMSTVQEVIAANHCGMKVLGFSLIANKAAGMTRGKLTEEEVLEAGERVAKTLQDLISRIVGEL